VLLFAASNLRRVFEGFDSREISIPERLVLLKIACNLFDLRLELWRRREWMVRTDIYKYIDGKLDRKR